MSILTIPQQYEFMQLAAIGVLPYDALVVVGIDPTEAETLCSDLEVIKLHRRGRAEGATKARKQLIKAGERGSVSAIKALKLYQDDDEINREMYGQRRPAAKPVRVDVIKSVEALFAKMRALHESVAKESNNE